MIDIICMIYDTLSMVSNDYHMVDMWRWLVQQSKRSEEDDAVTAPTNVWLPCMYVVTPPQNSHMHLIF